MSGSFTEFDIRSRVSDVGDQVQESAGSKQHDSSHLEPNHLKTIWEARKRRKEHHLELLYASGTFLL